MGGQCGWAGPGQWIEMLVGSGFQVLIIQMRISACRGQKTQSFPRGPPGMWLPKR